MKQGKKGFFQILYDNLGVILVTIILLAVILLTMGDWFDLLKTKEEIPSIEQIAPEERDQLEPFLQKISSKFSSPAQRIYADTFWGEFSSDSPATLSDQYTQSVDGTVQRIASIENIREGHSTAYMIWIQKQEMVIQGLYFGDVGELNIGDVVVAEGVYSTGGEGILFDWIIPEGSNDRNFFDNYSPAFLVAAVCTAIWLLYNLIRLLRKKKPAVSSKIVFFLMALAVVISTVGCTLDVVTVVEDDGKGFVMTSICDVQENFDFFRQMPGMAEYLDNRILNFRAHGGMVENSITAGQECLNLQNPFSGFGDITSSDGGRGWIYMDMRDMRDGTHYRFTALVDTTTLYEIDTSINTTVQNEINNELDSVSFTYTVVLPGEIVYHNADRVEGDKAIWDIPMNDSREIVLESKLNPDINIQELGITPISSGWDTYKEWIILGVVFVFSTILFVFNEKRGKRGK